MPTYGVAICTTSEIGKIRNKGGWWGREGERGRRREMGREGES